MSRKTLIIYATHKISENLLFFCRNGYIDDPKYDFVFVFNDPDLKIEFCPKKENIRIINRENIGLDFGAWTCALLSYDLNGKYLYETYDYFILINSTVRGPFLPLYYDKRIYGYWPELFISKLNNDVKLVGTTVNIMKTWESIMLFPHIQSMFLVTDRIGLDIGIKNKIFDLNNIKMDKTDIIYTKEVGLSKLIIENGYNITSMLSAYKNIDFRKNIPHCLQDCATDHIRPNNYFDININPYEVIFFKTNDDIDLGIFAKHNEWKLMLERYTRWNIKNINFDAISKILYGISENEAIDCTEKIKTYLSNKLFLDTDFYMGDPYPGKSKKIFIYSKGKAIDEYNNNLLSNLIFLC